jgi:hypothetical protein
MDLNKLKKDSEQPEVEQTPEVAEDLGVQFSSHPIQRYRLGRRWQFENWILKLTDPEEIAEFRKAVESLPPAERLKIKELDLAAAERISREYRSTGGATKAIDSSIGDRSQQPKTGTGILGVNSTGEVK